MVTVAVAGEGSVYNLRVRVRARNEVGARVRVVHVKDLVTVRSAPRAIPLSAWTERRISVIQDRLRLRFRLRRRNMVRERVALGMHKN